MNESGDDLTGRLLWEPSAVWRERSELARFMAWLAAERGLSFATYEELWAWSVDDLAGFWGAVWDHAGIVADHGADVVLDDAPMPDTTWFPGARLNYAEHIVGGRFADDAPAVLAHSQTRDPISLSYGELTEAVARARVGLRRLGVGPGDRVAAYAPNIPETLVAFLATASLGAVWSSCAAEFGERSVIDRFGQIEPKVLLTVSGYTYGDKPIDRRDQVAAILDGLPTVSHVIHVPYGPHPLTDIGEGRSVIDWGALVAESAPMGFEPVPFDHPLYVLFSSGTTGLPKAIVHGHGGILLEHIKNHRLSWDLGPDDRLMWFSTTAWMMWNALVSSLLVGTSIVMIDGNPLHPDLEYQWRLCAETGSTMLGLNPTFIMACRKAGIEPARNHDLSKLRLIGSAGSPLPPEGAAWLTAQLGPDVLLINGSGGTDVCTGIVQGNPLLPVWAGEISGRCLGVATDAFDEAGDPVVEELGELVITRPMPSMPVAFWGDDDRSRLRAAYFDHYPGVWRQGDWIRFTDRGSCLITGRSDATLNRGGVRLGTSEFYQVVEELPEVVDSLVVHLEDPEGGMGRLVLFVVPAPGHHLDDDLKRRITGALRAALSPRHAPDEIVEMPGVPRSLTGKRLELPVKRMMQGAAPEAVASRDALAEPAVLDAYATYVAGP